MSAWLNWLWLDTPMFGKIRRLLADEPIKFKTWGNLPIILEKSIEYTSNECKWYRKMSACDRLDLKSLRNWMLWWQNAETWRMDGRTLWSSEVRSEKLSGDVNGGRILGAKGESAPPLSRSLATRRGSTKGWLQGCRKEFLFFQKIGGGR